MEQLGLTLPEAPPRSANSRGTVLTIVDCRPELFRPEFGEWLEENWGVWDAFCSEANKVWHAGRRRYSARTIGEFLRHHTAISSPGETFKLNDWYWPDLARLYMALYPDRDGFFERRPGQSRVRAQ